MFSKFMRATRRVPGYGVNLKPSPFPPTIFLFLFCFLNESNADREERRRVAKLTIKLRRRENIVEKCDEKFSQSSRRRRRTNRDFTRCFSLHLITGRIVRVEIINYLTYLKIYNVSRCPWCVLHLCSFLAHHFAAPSRYTRIQT